MVDGKRVQLTVQEQADADARNAVHEADAPNRAIKQQIIDLEGRVPRTLREAILDAANLAIIDQQIVILRAQLK